MAYCGGIKGTYFLLFLGPSKVSVPWDHPCQDEPTLILSETEEVTVEGSIYGDSVDPELLEEQDIILTGKLYVCMYVSSDMIYFQSRKWGNTQGILFEEFRLLSDILANLNIGRYHLSLYATHRVRQK